MCGQFMADSLSLSTACSAMQVTSQYLYTCVNSNYLKYFPHRTVNFRGEIELQAIVIRGPWATCNYSLLTASN